MQHAGEQAEKALAPHRNFGTTGRTANGMPNVIKGISGENHAERLVRGEVPFVDLKKLES